MIGTLMDLLVYPGMVIPERQFKQAIIQQGLDLGINLLQGIVQVSINTALGQQIPLVDFLVYRMNADTYLGIAIEKRPGNGVSSTIFRQMPKMDIPDSATETLYLFMIKNQSETTGNTQRRCAYIGSLMFAKVVYHRQVNIPETGKIDDVAINLLTLTDDFTQGQLFCYRLCYPVIRTEENHFFD